MATHADGGVILQTEAQVHRTWFGRPPLEIMAVLLALTGLLCLAYWRFLLPGDNPDALFFGCDYWGQQYPNILFGRQAVLDHTLPFWEPYSNLGGRPGFAEAVRSYAYLPNVITFAIGAWLTPAALQAFWVFRVLLHIAVGGTAVYLLLRRMNYGWGAGLLAGVLFSFAGFQQAAMHLANFTDGFALLPWILLLWQWTRSQFSMIRLTVLAVILSQLLCAAYQNLYIYAFLLIVAWTLAETLASGRSRREILIGLRKDLVIAGAAFVCGVLLALVQVLPSMQVIGESFRSDVQGLDWSLGYQRLPHQVFEFFWPSFYTTTASMVSWWKYENVTLYVGIVPLFLIPLVFLYNRPSSHKSTSIRWVFITLPFVLLTFGGETRLHDLLYLTVPLYGFFRASNNAWAVAMLGIAVLSGIALDMLVAGKGRAASPRRVAAVLAGFLFISFSVLHPVVQEFLRGDVAGSPEHILGQVGRLLFWSVLVAFGLLSLRSYRTAGTILLIAVAFLDLSGQLGKNLFCNRGTVNPAVIFEENRLIVELRSLVTRYPGPVRVRFAPEMPQYSVAEHYKIFTDNGHSIIETPQDQAVKFLTASPTHPFTNIAFEVTYVRIPDRRPVSELVISPEEARRNVFANTDGFGLAARRAGDRIYIYQNPEVYPRAFFVKSVQTVAPQDLRSAFARTDLRSVALVAPGDMPPGVLTTPLDMTGNEVIGITYEANSVTVDVRAARDGILVVSDTYLPGWAAESDGNNLPLFRVNGKFRGVLVPAGAQRLVFRYTPPGFRLGLLISSTTLVTLLLLGGFTILRARLRRSQEGLAV